MLFIFHFQIMYYAVYKSMKGTLGRRHAMQRLILIPDENIPKEILANISNQLRPCRTVPIGLHEYDAETIKNYPKIMDYPKDYVME